MNRKMKSSFLVVTLSLVIVCMIPNMIVYAGYEREPNDTIATATTFGPNDKGNGTISSSSDVDYFKFTVSSNDTVVDISLSGLQTGMDYDFDVRNSSNTKIAQVRTGPGSDTRPGHSNRREYYKKLNAGTYYVRVFTRGGCNNRTYALEVDLLPYSTSLQLNVESIAQKKSNWCWAAVAEMVGKFLVLQDSLGNSSTTRNQLNCVGLIDSGNPNLSYNQLPNRPAYNDSEFQRAVQYVANNNQYSGRFSVSRPHYYSVTQIHSMIYEYRWPVAIGISANNQMGHYLVVIGLKASTGTLYIRDPYNTPYMNSTGGPALMRNVSHYDLIANGYLPGSDNRLYQMTLIQNN